MKLETYLDKKLTLHDEVYFNPGLHTMSVNVSTRALISLVKPTIAEFTLAHR